MNTQRICMNIVVTIACLTLTGCMPKMTIEDIKAMKPQRPAELDKLDAWVGKWHWDGVAHMSGLDQPLKFTGDNEVAWQGDRWFTVSHEVGHMEEFGETKGLATWTYDVHDKKYRTTWVDSMGTCALGEGWHDEKTDTWHMRMTGYRPFGKSMAKGTATFTNKDTINWTWAEYAMGGLMKTMEMTGTSKRQ